MSWYIKKLVEYYNVTGVKLVDYIDVHIYPQFGEVDGAAEDVHYHSIISM